MKMGRDGKLTPKFPDGESRLINGHEGVVWVPSENRFAIKETIENEKEY